MAAVKVLARDWEIAIKVAAAFVPILGLNTLTFEGSKNDADTTSFEDDGWESHLVASRGRSIKMEGFYLEDPADDSRDPGQEAVEALDEAMGQDSLGVFRRTSPSGTVKYFRASASVTSTGGGNNDPTGWAAELRVSGQVSDTDPSL